MSCPFKHLFPGASAPHKVTHSAHPEPPSAPEDAAEAQLEQPKSPSPAAGVCPMGFGASSPQQAPSSPTAPPATCPLGFGSSSARGPKLTPLHCILCKSLLFDCVVTNCGHRYCRLCASPSAHHRMQDCPACGADVTSLSPDPDAQAAVEAVIDSHAHPTTPQQAEGISFPNAAAAFGASDSAATFLLQIGLAAMAGGNLESAAHRLRQCKAALQAQLTSAGETGGEGCAGAILSQVGAVCGCLGDCARSSGDFATALECYRESAVQMRAAVAAGDAEAAPQLGIALNKIGEALHSQGDVEAALVWYGEALALRKQRWTEIEAAWSAAAGEGDGAVQERLEAALDVAVGEAKVADAMQTLGRDAGEAAERLAAANELMAQPWVAATAPLAPPAMQRKLAAVQAHLSQFRSSPDSFDSF